MRRWILALLLPLSGTALEVQPWFGDVYEFHFLGSYAFSCFDSVQNSRPPYHHFFYSNLFYSGLEFSPSPVWDIDGDLQLANTSEVPFNFRTAAIQARYLWQDDIIGDPMSFATGGNIRATATSSLKD